MKRVAVRNPFFLHARERIVKVLARLGERVMLVSFRAPGSKLQREIIADSDHCEWSILAFQFESHNVDIEINAGRPLVDVENYVIDCGHDASRACIKFAPS